MKLAHSVDRGGSPQRDSRHVKRVAFWFVTAERQKCIAPVAGGFPEARQLAVHHVKRKNIVTRRYWCVRGEHRSRAHVPQSRKKTLAFGDHLANPFQNDKGGVSFIEVPDAGLVPQRPQSPHPSDS